MEKKQSSIESLSRALSVLGDAQLCEVVSAATVGREDLRALHQVAQLSLVAGPASGEELSGATLSAAGGVVRAGDVEDLPVGEVPPLGRPGGSGSGDDEGWTSDGIPTFSKVRDRIAAKFAVAIGAPETDVERAESLSLEQQWENRARAARERLEQIKGIMRK
ncbi:hypothetical protein [Lolliginicoccus suaedae]|uniref:hypothetical protein n=1 Tax=Lolliginicoccus suaedae TaxID=2605429 RepID=UPI001F3A2B52|nr:hypothetical protein [Lolliginicoccus suaedae]